MVAWGDGAGKGRRQDLPKEMRKLWGDECLDYGDGFTGANTGQNVSYSTL